MKFPGQRLDEALPQNLPGGYSRYAEFQQPDGPFLCLFVAIDWD
ncbi:MAG: hypothetical protein Q7S40_06455 [Opitutaceae bacterium]|nr:hypothetical protein [Opitutaceae bacterium]